MKINIHKLKRPVGQIKIGLGITLLALVAGCFGYVGGGYDAGGDYGGVVVVPGPFFFDGYYEGGRDVHAYSHRGYESRSAAHGWQRGRR